MGELVYTNLEGLATASTDFTREAGNIAQIKRTLNTELNNFTDDMIGNALQPMRNCTTQIDVQLYVVNDKFAAISELLQNLMAARAWMDNGLAKNAAGKMRSNIVRELLVAPAISECNSLQRQRKERVIKRQI